MWYRFRGAYHFLSPENGGGSGSGSDAGGTTGGKEEKPKNEEDPASNKEKTGDKEKPKDPPAPLAKFTQEEVDAIAAKIRREEKDKLEKARKEEEAKQQGKYQELYESEKTKTTALEAEAAKASKLAEQLNGQIDQEIKEWPDSIKALDPGSDDIEKRTDWVAKARLVIKDIKATHIAPDGEHGKGNGGNGNGKGPTVDSHLRNKYGHNLPKKA